MTDTGDKHKMDPNLKDCHGHYRHKCGSIMHFLLAAGRNRDQSVFHEPGSLELPRCGNRARRSHGAAVDSRTARTPSIVCVQKRSPPHTTRFRIHPSRCANRPAMRQTGVEGEGGYTRGLPAAVCEQRWPSTPFFQAGGALPARLMQATRKTCVPPWLLAASLAWFRCCSTGLRIWGVRRCGQSLATAFCGRFVRCGLGAHSPSLLRSPTHGVMRTINANAQLTIIDDGTCLLREFAMGGARRLAPFPSLSMAAQYSFHMGRCVSGRARQLQNAIAPRHVPCPTPFIPVPLTHERLLSVPVHAFCCSCCDVATACCGLAVTVDVKCRRVVVKGPRGTLTRSFKHLQLDVRKIDPKTIQVDSWFASKKVRA